MQSIDAIQVTARPAIRAENRIREIDEVQAWIRFGVGLDQAVGLADNRPLLPAGWGRGDRDVVDRCLR